MAELKPIEGENLPPPLVPPPLGFAGLGDAYSGAPNVPALRPDISGLLANINVARRAVPALRGLDVLGEVFIPDDAFFAARANVVPKALSGQPLSEEEQSAFIASLPFAGVKKAKGTEKIVKGAEAALSQAAKGLSSLTDDALASSLKSAAPAERQGFLDEAARRITAMSAGAGPAEQRARAVGQMGTREVAWDKITRAIQETTPFKSVTGKGPGSFGAAVRKGVETGNPQLEAQFARGFLEKALLDAGFTPEAAQKALSQIDPGVVDRALVVTGQDITPATREVAAKALGDLAAAKASNVASQTPETLAAIERQVAERAARHLEDVSKMSGHPIRSLSSLSDLAGDVAMIPDVLVGTPIDETAIALLRQQQLAREVLSAADPIALAKQRASEMELAAKLRGPTQAETEAIAAARDATLRQQRLPFGEPPVPPGRPPTAIAGEPPSIPRSSGPVARPLGVSLWEKIKASLGEIPGAIGSTRNIAGGDFGAAGNQLFPMLFGHPRSAIRGNIEGIMGFNGVKQNFDDAMRHLRRLVEETGISVGDNGLFHSVEHGGIVRGEPGTAGTAWLKDKLPALFNLPVVGGVARGYGNALSRSERAMLWPMNAVRTHSYLSSIKTYEWAYGRSLTLPEKLGIAKSINILTGRGFNGTSMRASSDVVVGLASIANAIGFSPQSQFARARLIAEVPKAIARTMWNAGHGAAPIPGDVEMIRGGAAYVAGVMGMLAVGAASGLKIFTDMNGANFTKVDLGPIGFPGMAQAVTLAEFFGFRTQSYNGHVYLDSGASLGGDLRLLTQLVGPLVGVYPTDQKGKAWNPWAAKPLERTPSDLIKNWLENKLLPGYGFIASRLEDRPIDLGDPTQNPITTLTLPMAIQGGLAASGEAAPGGSLYFPQFSNLSPSDVEKQRLRETSAVVPGLTTLGGQRQQEFGDRVSVAVRRALDAVVASPQYQQQSPEEKKTNILRVTDEVGRETRRKFAISVASSGSPGEIVPAVAIALSSSPSNLLKAQSLGQIADAGRLTPDIARQVNALRTQTDRAKPSYDASVEELMVGRDLSSRWLAAPEFVVGSKPEWDAAAIAATRLRALRAEDERNGKKPSEDTELIDFYASAAGGALASYYTISGAKRPQLVSPERMDIQQHPLWPLFAQATSRVERPTVR